MGENTDCIDESLPDTNLTFEQVFDILGHRRRRRILTILAESTEESVQVSRLINKVAEFENGEESRQRVRVALIQQHLPSLADAGVIGYAKGAKRVEIYDAEYLGTILEIISKTTAEDGST